MVSLDLLELIGNSILDFFKQNDFFWKEPQININFKIEINYESHQIIPF